VGKVIGFRRLADPAADTQDDSTIVPGGFSDGSELQKIKTSTDVVRTQRGPTWM
jgi:hypothetical protein